MSSRRPGTVDYSKWDNFECSDSEAEEEEHHYHNFDGAINSDDEEEEDSYEDDGEEDEEGDDDDDDDDDDSEESRILEVPSQRPRTVPSNSISISRSAPKIPPPSLL